MREIWISFGVVVICGVMIIASAVFNIGGQQAIADEITQTSEVVQIAANPAEETENMDNKEALVTLGIDVDKIQTTDECGNHGFRIRCRQRVSRVFIDHCGHAGQYLVSDLVDDAAEQSRGTAN